MRAIYIADDGTQFDDRFDCEDYEWKLNHPHLKDVHIFDKDGNKFDNVFSEDAYNYSDKIVVTSNGAVKDLHDLANYTGYCYYEHVNEVGEWRFDETKEKFVMM
jgi:hypothetical protein